MKVMCENKEERKSCVKTKKKMSEHNRTSRNISAFCEIWMAKLKRVVEIGKTLREPIFYD